MRKSMENPLARLRQFITEYYDQEELRTLCFDLGIDYDNLRGENKAAKARELVLCVGRHGQLDELLALLGRERPTAFKEVGLGMVIVEALYPSLPIPEADAGPQVLSNQPEVAQRLTTLGNRDEFQELSQRQPQVAVVQPKRHGARLKKDNSMLATRQPFEPEMVLVPASEFLMGSDPKKDKSAQEWEHPQHSLYLPDYYLAKTPVTNAQYATFVESTRYDAPEHWREGKPPSGKENYPVVYVSWHDAVSYCRWLAEVTGRAYRLPTEAEWEKGARGSDGRIYPWGDQWDAKRSNSGESGKEGTTSVEGYPLGRSPFGLFDMSGNVWEWTISLWGENWEEPEFKYPYDPDDGREGMTAGDNILRILRGGSYLSVKRYVRSTSRLGYIPNCRYRDFSVRVAANPL